MVANVGGRNYLKLLDYTLEEIRCLLDLSKEFKNMKRNGVPHRYLENKNIVLLFEKTSTRTRCAFEAAGMDLDMGVTYLDSGSSQMGKKESIAGMAGVLGRTYDGIECRGFDQKIVDELVEYAGVSVRSELTSQLHPAQMLADPLTLEEEFGRLKGPNFTYMGDIRNNMGNSLMVACAKIGINFTVCAPKELFPAEKLASRAREIAGKNGCTVRPTEDIDQGAKDADAVYADIWVSAGEPGEVWGTRIKLLRGYQVNAEAMKKAKSSAIFMHRLPSFHDINTTIGVEIVKKFSINEMEVINEVFESRQSVVFDEVENHMHIIKTVIYATLCRHLLLD